MHGDVKPANFLNGKPRLASTDEFSHAFGHRLRFKDDWVSLFLSYLSLASGGKHLTNTQKRRVLATPRPDDSVSARIWDKCQ